MTHLLAVLAIIFALATSSPASARFCADSQDQTVAAELMLLPEVNDYSTANHHAFADIGVKACEDEYSFARVTATWLRTKLPASPALDRILETSKTRSRRAWSVLFALHIKIVERQHREEEELSAWNERNLDPTCFDERYVRLAQVLLRDPTIRTLFAVENPDGPQHDVQAWCHQLKTVDLLVDDPRIKKITKEADERGLDWRGVLAAAAEVSYVRVRPRGERAASRE